MVDNVAMQGRLKPWLLAVAAALPFQLLYLFDYIIYGDAATGFIMVDMPYYAANGRAYFDHGNGLLHPNPYDPHSPNIYFQLSTWFIGAFNQVTSLDPGFAMGLLGIIFSVLFARTSYSLVQTRLQSSSHLTLTYFIVMFGGGLFTVRSVIEILVGTAPAEITRDTLLTLYEPAYGWWTLSWGRNMILATEALYHWLMALAWLAYLREQWTRAAIVTVIIMLAHPWTGLVALAVFGAWFTASWITYKRFPSGTAIAIVVTGALCFTWYYGIFLPSYPSHKWIVETWRGLHIMRWTWLFFSLSLSGVLLLIYLRVKDRTSLNKSEAFFAVASCVVLLLSKNDLFIEPIQPLHFNRGYLWFALVMFSLPAIPYAAKWLHSKLRSMVVVLLLLAFSDNIGFFISEYATRAAGIAMYVPKDVVELYRYSDSSGLKGFVATDHWRTSYPAASYTALRPYIGHPYLTFDLQSREVRLTELISGRSSRLLDSVDFLILHDTSGVHRSRLKHLARRGSYSIYEVQ